MKVLIIGGTRNLGHFLALELLRRGHEVTVFNRGRTPDSLPADVERLRGDRGNPLQLVRALSGRRFDVVVDTALYNGPDAAAAAEALQGRVAHYVFLSTGQVYLVREGIERPFREDDYDGPVMKAPPQERDKPDWLYGVEKREAEDALRRAHEEKGFPVTTFRLPMVHGERDHFHRVLNYLLRLQDGGPIFAPAPPHLRLRHLDGLDAVRTIAETLEKGAGKGKVYNLSQAETLELEEFLILLARIAGRSLSLKRLPRKTLEDLGLLPACSPFSDPWMSELDNRRAREELGFCPTPLEETLRRVVAHLQRTPPPTPEGYRRRKEELEMAEEGAP